MVAADPNLRSFTDAELRSEIRLLEIQIAVCEAQIESDATELKRSNRIARGTFLTAAGFFGLTLDLFSAVIVLVGCYDWIEGLRDDASAANIRMGLRRRLTTLKERFAELEAEVLRRSDGA